VTNTVYAIVGKRGGSAVLPRSCRLEGILRVDEERGRFI
jgi:hypothetical protein